MNSFKRIVSLILAVCMGGFILASAQSEIAAPVEPIPDESAPQRYMRVGLSYGSSAVNSLSVSNPYGFIIARGDSFGWEEVSRTNSLSLSIKAAGGKAVLYDGAGNVLLGDMSGYVIMGAEEDPSARMVNMLGSRYRDGFAVTVYANSKLNVINYIELENYVRGCIANEMPSSYPEEALKAQAITARSYAIKSLGGHKTYGFDICATQHCQVYRGVSSERASTDEATLATKNLALSYNGEIVRGYYFSTSGGCTLDSGEVWPSDLGYCVGVKDEFFADKKWENSITAADLGAKLKAAGQDIGAVTGVQITERTAHGAVKAVTLTGSLKTLTVTKSFMANILGASSYVFAIKAEPFTWDNNAVYYTAEPINAMGGGGNAASVEGKVTVLGAGGATGEVKLTELSMFDGISMSSPVKIPHSGYEDDAVRADVIYISGNGTFHGVGMPQTSARNMAGAGYSCEQILKYYYRGIEIVDLTGENAGI